MIKRKLEELEKAFSQEVDDGRVYTLEDEEEISKLPDDKEILFDYTFFIQARHKALGIKEPMTERAIRKGKAGSVKRFIEAIKSLARIAKKNREG